MNRNRRNNSGGASSALALVLLAIFAMPILGIYLLTRKNDTDRIWGAILTTLGLILWVAICVTGA